DHDVIVDDHAPRPPRADPVAPTAPAGRGTRTIGVSGFGEGRTGAGAAPPAPAGRGTARGGVSGFGEGRTEGAAPPRGAATVVLLRDGRGGLEAYLQRRPMGMGFAGGLWVFPGGRVDEADRDPAVEAAWAGPPAAEWAERLGLGIEEARGHVV